MPSTCCCVPGCCNRGGLSFPREPMLQKRWLIAVRRSDESNQGKMWKPSPHSVVCHSHFRPSDFIAVTSYGCTPLRKQRKPDAVPSIFPWTESANALEADGGLRKSRIERRENKKRKFKAMDTDCDIECDISEVAGEEIIDNVEFDDMNTDLNICSADSAEVEYEHDESTSAQTDKFPMLSIQSIMFNAAAILFYTGLSNYTDFTFVLASLGPCAYHLNYLYSKVDSITISVENQLLLTLMKLRRHKTNFELGLHFGISEKTVLNVWITWVNFMYRQWSELDNWPERDLVHYFCPSDFKSKFPSTRIIIDGTECPIQKPKRPIAQQSTYSTYKNRNTIKILVGSTPGGLVSYVSPAYGGSTSDRQIVERSGLTVMCDPGDSIMADKGFNVQDIFAPKDVTINMPTFFSKKNRMSGKTVMRDRKISSKRVHIERIIGLAKTFKILTEPLNSSETKLATEITTVCFMLCSFKKCIVPSTC